MDSLAQDRWAEIQLYYICIDILKIKNDIMDIMNTIDFMSNFGEFSSEKNENNHIRNFIVSPLQTL